MTFSLNNPQPNSMAFGAELESQLNTLFGGLSSTEFSTIDGVTAGTAAASKAIILGSTWAQSSNVEQISTSGTPATDIGALTTAVNAILTCLQNAAGLMGSSS